MKQIKNIVTPAFKKQVAAKIQASIKDWLKGIKNQIIILQTSYSNSGNF